MIPPRPAAAWFALQGLAVPAWWVALAVWPEFRALFELGDRQVLQSFLVPDVAFGLASLLAARLIVSGHPAAVAVAGITTGAVGYSTVMTFGRVLAAGEGAVGAVAMTLAALASAVALRSVPRGAR